MLTGMEADCELVCSMPWHLAAAYHKNTIKDIRRGALLLPVFLHKFDLFHICKLIAALPNFGLSFFFMFISDKSMYRKEFVYSLLNHKCKGQLAQLENYLKIKNLNL